MKTAHPIVTPQQLEAFHASALFWLAWLTGVVLRMASPRRSARLRGLLERMERFVENILFLEAVRRCGPPPKRRRHPRPAPSGFRRSTKRSRFMFKRAGVRARRACALERILSLCEALARPARYVAYFMKRLVRGLRAGALVVAAPPAFSFADHPGPGAAFADSS